MCPACRVDCRSCIVYLILPTDYSIQIALFNWSPLTWPSNYHNHPLKFYELPSTQCRDVREEVGYSGFKVLFSNTYSAFSIYTLLFITNVCWIGKYEFLKKTLNHSIFMHSADFFAIITRFSFWCHQSAWHRPLSAHSRIGHCDRGAGLLKWGRPE